MGALSTAAIVIAAVVAASLGLGADVYPGRRSGSAATACVRPSGLKGALDRVKAARAAKGADMQSIERLSVPGPPRLLGGLANVARYVRDPVGHLSLLFGRYGPVVSLARGGGTWIVSPFPNCPGSVCVYGPELVRKVKTPHASWEIPPYGHPLPARRCDPAKSPLKTFATGLWGVQGDEHREHRKLLLPAFHRERVAGYRDDIVALTSRMFEHWARRHARTT